MTQTDEINRIGWGLSAFAALFGIAVLLSAPWSMPTFLPAVRGDVFAFNPAFVPIGAVVVGGVLLALNIDVVVPFIERMLGVHFLSKEVYYISDLPSELQWGDVWGVTLIAFVLALLATLLRFVSGSL